MVTKMKCIYTLSWKHGVHTGEVFYVGQTSERGWRNRLAGHNQRFGDVEMTIVKRDVPVELSCYWENKIAVEHTDMGYELFNVGFSELTELEKVSLIHENRSGQRVVEKKDAVDERKYRYELVSKILEEWDWELRTCGVVGSAMVRRINEMFISEKMETWTPAVLFGYLRNKGYRVDSNRNDKGVKMVYLAE